MIIFKSFFKEVAQKVVKNEMWLYHTTPCSLKAINMFSFLAVKKHSWSQKTVFECYYSPENVKDESDGYEKCFLSESKCFFILQEW